MKGLLWRAGFTAVLCLVAAPVGLRAASLYDDGVGARARAMAGTGAAGANDPLSALFENPAAMCVLDVPTVAFGEDTAIAHGSFHDAANSHSTMEAVGEIGEMAVTLPAGPLRFGVGINPDIALRTGWRYRDAPGGADGSTTYGVRRNASEIGLVRGALGASWQMCPTFAIGASLGVLYNENQLHAPYVFQSQPVLRGFKTILNLDTSGFGANGQVALRWHPLRNLSLSAVYTSSAGIDSHGSARGDARTQLDNVGLGAERPAFSYNAEVTNHFPQQVTGGISWEPTPHLTINAQLDWVDWSDAFDTLPIRLSRGNNPSINALVGSSKLDDNVPLNWHDQYVGRIGAEREFGDHWFVRGGYSYGNDPVPAGTLTPLNAAITEHALSAGVGYRIGRVRVDAAYQWELPATGRVRRSELAAGEYSGSVTEVDVQWISLSTTIGF